MLRLVDITWILLQLSEDLQDDTSGAYEDLLKALIRTPIENLAHFFRAAVDGWGTNTRLVIDVLVSCTEKGTMPTEMKDAYKRSQWFISNSYLNHNLNAYNIMRGRGLYIATRYGHKIW